MSPFSKLPCWVIMNCAEDKQCPAKQYPKEDCWEIFSEIDNSSFNICQDCIVFISRQEEAVLSSKEIERVMLKKGIVISAFAGRSDNLDN